MEKFPENFHRKNYEIVTPRSQACSLRKSIYEIAKENMGGEDNFLKKVTLKKTTTNN